MIYSDLDWQLLFELRVALLRGKPLPIPLLRVLRARGWVAIPGRDRWIHVRAAMEDEPEQTVEAFSYDVACPILLHAGKEEIRLHARGLDDECIEELLEGEEEDTVDDFEEEEEEDWRG